MTQKLLQSIDEVAHPSHSALIVIDPQHDFCSEHGTLAQRFGLDMKDIQKAVGHLNAFIGTCCKADVPVIWVWPAPGLVDTRLS